LLTLALLGLLAPVFEHFEKIVLSAQLMSWLLEERRKIQFHQPSRVRDALALKRLLDNGMLARFESVAIVPPELEHEVGSDLAAMLVAAKEGVEGDDRQRLVVRPAPLGKAGTLMDEPADIGGYEQQLVGCGDTVVALKRLGRLTATEEARCVSYLSLHEQKWPNAPLIADRAVLYLDGLAIVYLLHLGILERLKAAGFTILVAIGDLADGDALVNHEAFAAEAQTLVEDIRSTVAAGVASGKVVFGELIRAEDEENPAYGHPTTTFFNLSRLADALVIDDRALNVHRHVTATEGRRGVFSTLEVLETLAAAGTISVAQKGEHLTKLRRAGFALIPVSAEELESWLASATVADGQLVETAELRAIRESILRVRMTDVLQLPQEHPWLDDINRVLIATIKGVWARGFAEDRARALSNWLLPLVDIRNWGHRTPPQTGLPQIKYAAQILLLATIPGASKTVRDAYWKWLDETMLRRLKQENDASYQHVLKTIQELIEEGIRRTEGKFG
jgi:hypothetical protein